MAKNPKWTDLFSADRGQANSHLLQLRVVQKRGCSFLVLPMDAQPAVEALSLYSAQTPAARLFKAFLRFVMTCRIPLGFETAELRIATDARFVQFLLKLGNRSTIPPLAIACGNPRTEGQRFIILIFDPAGQPSVIVKAGLSEIARSLIAKEDQFLKNVPAKLGIPRVRESFESEQIRTLSLDYMRGQSPRFTDYTPMFSLVNSWLEEAQPMPLQEFALWRQLKLAVTSPHFSKLEPRIAEKKIYSTIYHGDFAPWNIKVNHDSWTALDWERGELAGIPGWDCFHFLIQPAILVTRTSTASLVEEIETFLHRDDFRSYAKRAQIAGAERELVLSYLLQQIDVIKPSEGMVATQNLFNALACRWLAAA